MKTSGGVILCLAGVGVIYLGYTGYWRSFWTGLQGGFAVKPSDQTTDNIPEDGDVNTGTTPVQKGGEGATKFDPANLFNNGTQYYAAPTGILMASNEGHW